MHTDWLNYKWLCVSQSNTLLNMNAFQIDSYTLFHNLLSFNMFPGKSDIYYVYYLLGPFMIVN